MCDLGHAHDHQHFGFLVDTPEIRALIAETQRLNAAIADPAARVEALRPAFSRLLAAGGWLPESCRRARPRPSTIILRGASSASIADARTKRCTAASTMDANAPCPEEAR